MFRHRSYEKELLDREDIPAAAIRKNMEELRIINKKLGGHPCTIQGLIQSLERLPAPTLKRAIHICEVGCGGGDNLKVIARWCEKNKREAYFTGIDLNPHCIETAASVWEKGNITWICSTYETVHFDQKPDIVFSSLFCHHLNETQLDQHFRWLEANTGYAFFINDLHRNPVAYYSIRLLTKWFSRSYLVKNDAPLSVLRGFKRKEWKHALERNGFHSYQITWQWAFRWLVLVSVTQTKKT